MDTLITIHSWVRWLVLVALIGAVAIGWVRYRSSAAWDANPYRIAVMVVDVQVLLGILIWLFDSGWNDTFFFKVIHPVFMLVALGVAHTALIMGRKRADARAHLVVGGGLLASLVLIVLAIPWDRL
jgi:hypothetical protein